MTGLTGTIRFAHRPVEGGTYESICLNCFRTAGSARDESGLAKAEAQHACLAEDLIRLYGRIGPEPVLHDGHKKERA